MCGDPTCDVAPDDGNAPVQVLLKGGSLGQSREQQPDAALQQEEVVSSSTGGAATVGDIFSDAGRFTDDLLGAGGGGVAEFLN